MIKINLLALLAITGIFFSPARAQEKLNLCDGINKILSYYTTEANFENLNGEFGTSISGFKRSYKEYYEGFRFTMSAADPEKGNYKTLFKSVYKQLVDCTGDKAEISEYGGGDTKIAAFEYQGATIILNATFENKKKSLVYDSLEIKILRGKKKGS